MDRGRSEWGETDNGYGIAYSSLWNTTLEKELEAELVQLRLLRAAEFLHVLKTQKNKYLSGAVQSLSFIFYCRKVYQVQPLWKTVRRFFRKLKYHMIQQSTPGNIPRENYNSKRYTGFPGGAVVGSSPANAGTRVRAQVGEDPVCREATKPVRHGCWACALEPESHNYWAWVPQLLKPTHLEPVLHNKRSHCNEKPAHRN